MGYKLKLDLPNVGKGVEVYLEGLGVLENPGEYEVSDEEADAFRVTHQEVTYHQDEETGTVTHTTVEPGPTVLEYFEGREGIEVSVLKAKPKKKTETQSNTATGVDDVVEPQTHGGPQSNSPVVPVTDTGADDGSNKTEGGN